MDLRSPSPNRLPISFHGTRVVDSYRWLEKSDSPALRSGLPRRWLIHAALLDPLPGRDAIHKRLTELLSHRQHHVRRQLPDVIISIREREGMQNQPVLYVREGLDGTDRVLVDANQLAADGTIALDWFQPSDNGKYVAYGTSPSGSEMSTLHIIETKTGTILPDTIERTRAASIAWLHDNSGFYYTRYPNKGDVPDGAGSVQPARLLSSAWDAPSIPTDPIFGEGRDPEDWPSVTLSNDGRWLLINVSQGWTKSELFLQDLKSDKPPSAPHYRQGFSLQRRRVRRQGVHHDQ